MLRLAAAGILAILFTTNAQDVQASQGDDKRGATEVPVTVTGGSGHAEVQTAVTSVDSAGDGRQTSQVSESNPVREVSQRSGVSRLCFHGGVEISCHVGGAFWSAGRGCYVRRADPQPVASSGLWDGHRDAQGVPVGVIYVCLAPGAPPGGYDSWFSAFWVADGGVGEVEVVDPAELAERAVARMGLRAGRLGATPLPGRDARSVVGLPTWLWVDDVGEATWGPISRTATAGSVSVTARASVTDVVYHMGDGGSVRCTSPGTVWTPAAGAGPSPDCGYRYGEPGVYTVRAVSNWQVDWQGGGQSGTIEFSLVSQRDITVTQLQVVVTR